jgi:hypothetical protein
MMHGLLPESNEKKMSDGWRDGTSLPVDDAIS